MGKLRVSICMPADLWTRTKSLAARRRTSASELVAHALTRLLSGEEETRRAERMKAVQAIISAGLDVPDDPDELNRELSDAYMPHGMEELDDVERPGVH